MHLNYSFILDRIGHLGKLRIAQESLPKFPSVSMNFSNCWFVIACDRYLVGILDKKTNKMKVYDSQYYQLRPWLHNDSQDQTDQASEQTYIEKVSTQYY